MATVMEAVAPPAFDWKRWPETETVVEGLIAAGLGGNAFARSLAERMPGETGTRFSVWVDHLRRADAALADPFEASAR